MSGKTWEVYIEFGEHFMGAEYFDAYGDMDESDVVNFVLRNILIEARES